MSDEKNLVKIAFRDDDGDVETLWAARMGPNTYRLDNVPFFQYGVSWSDVIEAIAEGEGFPLFTRVLEKSGHRTMRALLEEPRDEEDPFFAHLLELGCTLERATPRFIAIDVPPGVDIQAVARHLAVSGVDWEPADPSWEDLKDKGDS